MPELSLNDLALTIDKPSAISYLLDELRENLRIMRNLMVVGDAVPMYIAQAIEIEALQILDLISPKMRVIEADFQSYQAMPKIGER
jgi:UDP-2,3-diacylglucosamine pyrophosphatase LpxH